MNQNADLRDLQKENSDLRKEILYLREEIATLKRLIFGKKSERFISTDPELPPNTLFTQEQQQPNESQPVENLTEQISYIRDKPVVRKGGRKTLPEHLHREIVILEPEQKEEDWKCIGKEVTEELEYKPGVLYVNRYERPKYVDPKNEKIHIAPMPSRVVDKCIAGPSLLSHTLVSKYLDHLPLHRQLQQLKRMHRIEIGKSTFGDWVTKYVNELGPLYEAVQKEILSSRYLQIDESPFKVQSDEVEGKCHLGYMWVCRNPQSNVVLFSYQKGRGGEYLKNHIGNFKGILQCDGWKTYEQLQSNPQIKLISCWAHARRYFEQAKDQDKARAEQILKYIQELYDIEKHCRENNYNNEQRQKWRHDHSVTILNTIKEYLDKNVDYILPDMAIGKAFSYAIKRWDKLSDYVNQGEVEIDNNLVENSIRPLALGRKNYLFAGSEESAQRAAIMYTLFGICILHNINPYDWLTVILSKIKNHPINRISELLPQNWSPETI